MHPKLQSLVIKNFRSIRGEVVIPLDAQVVLIHGPNGMGKSSILSALELGLTGKIAHLADDGDGYQKYLTNFGSGGGSIGLKLASPLSGYSKDYGGVDFSDTSYSSKPLLTPNHSRFFAERCFLPQSALGRLLEIYDDQTTTTNSPLTLFVKELLGLDPLDSLVDGLHPALHLAVLPIRSASAISDRYMFFDSNKLPLLLLLLIHIFLYLLTSGHLRLFPPI